jgi:DNA protecting protein DprA
VVPISFDPKPRFPELVTSHPWRILSLRDPSELLSRLPETGFAVVGTRHPQRRSLEFLSRTVESLRGSGLCILSGFARGIDEAAHEAALTASLQTLAILGCGIEVDYPRGSLALRRRILEAGGLILSPFPDQAAPLPGHFHERNRLIAGLSKAVWVVEGAAASGTLNTARWASELGRELFATPAFPGDPFFSGNEKLLSHARPDRHPLGQAFYGAPSLHSVWPSLSEPQAALPGLLPPEGLLRTILEVESEEGECRIGSLRARVGSRSWKDLAEELEKRVGLGELEILPSGRIRLQIRRS